MISPDKTPPHWFTDKSHRNVALNDFVVDAERAHPWVDIRINTSSYGPELLLFVTVPKYDLRDHRIGVLGTYGGKVRRDEAEKILAAIRASLDVEGVMKPKDDKHAAIAAPTA